MKLGEQKQEQEQEQEQEKDNGKEMPMLVYVSREKSRGIPHHFKAGALNVLLRVSGILSNAPYILASCAYEDDTKWGKEIGFLYYSVVEDIITSLNLDCGGWKSVYLDPPISAFLGSSPTNLADTLLQNKRWAAGLLQVAFSRINPLRYCMLPKTSILHSMCYAFLAFHPLYSLFVVCYAILPPICFLHGISVYPQVSNPWFLLFLAIYLSYLGQYLFDEFSWGRSFKHWWNEEKIWIMKSASSHFFGTLSIITKFIGVTEVIFELTNKVNDDEQRERYEKGIFDFQGVGVLVVPLVTIAMVNVVCFIGGVGRTIYEGSYDAMFGQICLTAFTIITTYTIIEGAIIRKDRGRISTSITLFSLLISIIILSLGYFAFML